MGIVLVQVPYWWNGSWKQLKATFRKKKPDMPLPETLKQIKVD